MSRTPPVDAVAVRMYRHGFGDCFLLRFFAADKPVFAVLVDCGIKLNTKSKTVPIEAVVDDLRKTLAPPPAAGRGSTCWWPRTSTGTTSPTSTRPRAR